MERLTLLSTSKKEAKMKIDVFSGLGDVLMTLQSENSLVTGLK